MNAGRRKIGRSQEGMGRIVALGKVYGEDSVLGKWDGEDSGLGK